MRVLKIADRLRRGIVRAMALVAVGCAALPAEAARHAALIVDGNTGRVISESAADEQRHPASLTKMMTLYMMFELIEQGRLTYNTRITFSEAAARVQPTKLGIAVGGSITALDAIKGLITKSANDAAVAVAEHIAGSEARFAELMTAKARAIGMRSTTFRNASGLPDSAQVTTARDMITLGLRLQDDFPQHYPLFAMREFRFNGGSHRNHNTMLGTYEGTDGIKTGYIGASGYNLVANVRRNNKHIIGVVFGGGSASSRNNTMKTLINIGLLKGATVKTRVPVTAASVATANAPVATRAVTVAPAVTVAVASAVPMPAPVARPVETANSQGEALPVARVRQVPLSRPSPREVAANSPPAAATLAPTGLPIAPDRGIKVATAGTIVPPQQVGQPVRQQLGASPSTLQQQAALAPAPQTPPPLASMQPNQTAFRMPPPTPGAAQVQIQIGAYSTKAEADRQLITVRDSAPDVLGASQPFAFSAQVAGKTVFRARFAGFDNNQASQVCNTLRRRQIDCLVTRAD